MNQNKKSKKAEIHNKNQMLTTENQNLTNHIRENNQDILTLRKQIQDLTQKILNNYMKKSKKEI